MPFLPYTEFVKFPEQRPSDEQILAVSEQLLRHHLRRRPVENPVSAFAKVFPAQVEEISTRDFGFFHLYAFNTLRQLGANFELFSSYLDWLAGQGRTEMSEGAESARAISTTCKTVQFKLARAVMRKKFDGLADGLIPAAEAWDRLMQHLDRHYGNSEPVPMPLGAASGA